MSCVPLSRYLTRHLTPVFHFSIVLFLSYVQLFSTSPFLIFSLTSLFPSIRSRPPSFVTFISPLSQSAAPLFSSILSLPYTKLLSTLHFSDSSPSSVSPSLGAFPLLSFILSFRHSVSPLPDYSPSFLLLYTKFLPTFRQSDPFLPSVSPSFGALPLLSFVPSFRHSVNPSPYHPQSFSLL